MAMTIDDVAEKFIDHAQSYDKTAPNKNWYVGITSNPEARKKRHEDEKDIKCKHFKYMEFKNEAIARELEQKLKRYGFSISPKDLLILEGKHKPKNHVYIYQAVSSRQA